MVCFSKEVLAGKFAFEIYWPLVEATRALLPQKKIVSNSTTGCPKDRYDIWIALFFSFQSKQELIHEKEKKGKEGRRKDPHWRQSIEHWFLCTWSRPNKSSDIGLSKVKLEFSFSFLGFSYFNFDMFLRNCFGFWLNSET